MDSFTLSFFPSPLTSQDLLDSNTLLTEEDLLKPDLATLKSELPPELKKNRL